jgi:hypothetical protein
VEAVLRRYRMPLLRHLDQNTGLPVRRPVPRRYERAAPGDLVHLDVKKLGRIPDGGGHRKVGRQLGRRHTGQRGRGYAFLHHAVDDHSRLAYSEILADEAKQTAAAFWQRANAFFVDHGITVKSVLTDNGNCDQAQKDKTVPTPNQRKSGTLQPHAGHRMGLRRHLPVR